MVHRDPSATDVLSNVIGTMLGGFHQPALEASLTRVETRKMESGACSGNGVRSHCRHMDLAQAMPSIARGATSPGILEADWKFDEGSGRIALDSSGHKLHGSFRNQPRRVAGVRGGAVTFDGATDYIDVGHSTAFRLAGSMTISALDQLQLLPERRRGDCLTISKRRRLPVRYNCGQTTSRNRFQAHQFVRRLDGALRGDAFGHRRLVPRGRGLRR